MIISNLPQIAALARSGAVARAWELFAQQEPEDKTSTPAAFAIKGRLLKGRARLVAGEERLALFAEAARAYQTAQALEPTPYLMINAASLNLLAGDAETAMRKAKEVLALLRDPATALDTPYFLAATRAEALLLLGDLPAAEAAMDDAARVDPEGWADRACTVAQLREIAAAQGSDPTWIDRFAPPASVHFAGHMGITAGGQSEARLTALLAEHFAQHPAGFAWGALAAGADIVIAEALVAAGAALHVVLPCPAEQFEAQSVAPAGAEWSERYARLMQAAASVRIAAESATSVHDPLATAFAGDLAIGGALCKAAQLASSAAQLIVCDEHGGGANTARQAERWRVANGPQYRLTVPRDAAVEALFPPEQPDPARQLTAHLAILQDALLETQTLSGNQLEAIAAPVAAALAHLPRSAVRSAPGGWEVAVTDLPAAIEAVAKLSELASVSVGGHLAISPLLADPASGATVPFGPAPALARRLAALAQPGTALASDALAVALAARGEDRCRAELYYPWEDELGGPVHLLIA